GCDELLGDKIHSVVQGGHHAQVCGPVVAEDFAMAKMPLLEDYGFPGASLESPVDSFSFSFDIGQQIVIALDVRAAWRTNLYENELALVGRPLFQHALDRQEPLLDSLGVIDAIDTHSNEHRIHTKLSQQSNSI